MSPQRIFGVVLLVVGVALFIVGLTASRSVVDQVSATFLGRFTESTTWYLIGGVAAAVMGGFLAMGKSGGRAA
jgi:hypothetical protein